MHWLEMRISMFLTLHTPLTVVGYEERLARPWIEGPEFVLKPVSSPDSDSTIAIC